jgi:hypothetical protein
MLKDQIKKIKKKRPKKKISDQKEKIKFCETLL